MPTRDDLTPSESAILIVLMAEGRDISNKELEDRFGISLTGQGRTKLNQLGFVESWKEGRTYTHRLGDAGWARCKEPMNFASPRARALGAALDTLLAAVHRDLARTNRSLAMAFGEPADATTPASEDLDEQIRAAYKTLAPAPGEWVSLADIRDHIGDAGTEQVDAALRRLEQEPDINIVPQANEKALSDRNRRAAVIIGQQPKHFIAIGV